MEERSLHTKTASEARASIQHVPPPGSDVHGGFLEGICVEMEEDRGFLLFVNRCGSARETQKYDCQVSLGD